MRRVRRRRTVFFQRPGLTLVEVLMSMLVTGIGLLSVITLLPLSFIRAVQATNLTNGTILRYNAESQTNFNPKLILWWQAQQAYVAGAAGALPPAGGDIVLVPSYPGVAFQCTSALAPPNNISGAVAPTWNPVVGQTTNDGGLVWTTVQNAQNPPPTAFVVDPLGWNALGGLQGSLGNNAGAVDPKALPRFNGEAQSFQTATQLVTLPDSWIEQARGPVTAFTANTATLSGPDLSTVGVASPIVSRIVLLDATGKFAQTRLITSITSPTVTWAATDPLAGGFTPISARVETQETRYTYLLTVRPTPSGFPTVIVTVFFRRPLTANDEQVYQTTGSDGVQTPFTVQYGGLSKPFVKKGGFLFDCYFGRWYRIVNIANDTGTQLDVFVDQPRPQADVLGNPGFGAVFLRGVVDFFPLVPRDLAPGPFGLAGP